MTSPARAILGSLIVASMLPAGAVAHPDRMDTYLHEAFTDARTVITPGLCAPGDTAGCVGPEIAEFRAFSDESSTCRLNGVFEGESYTDAPCSFDFYGFLTGVTPGTKPVCGAARFFLSDDTTAFGEGKVSTFTFDGMPRRIYIEGLSLGVVVAFTRVEIDDDDPDSDTEGDHIDIALPSPILRETTAGSGASCVEAPLTSGRLVSGTSLFV